MTETEIKLSKAYENPADGTRFDAVKLREPTYKDIYVTGLGTPFDVHATQGGAIVEYHYDVVAKYVERLLVSPDQPAAINGLNAVDSLKLQKAITGFFTGGVDTNTTGPSTSSSSNSASPTTASKE